MPDAKAADVSGGKWELTALGAAGSVGFGAVVGFLTWIGSAFGFDINPAVAKLLGGVGAVAGALFVVMYERYDAILKGDSVYARRDYELIRQSLNEGGTPARIYAMWLRTALGMVDRFFGDAGTKADPNWTAPAYDRCLLLALIYPVAMILIMWVASGHVGIAEQALGFRVGVPGWGRIAILALVCCFMVCARFVDRPLRGWRFFLLVPFVLALGALSFVGGGTVGGNVGFAAAAAAAAAAASVVGAGVGAVFAAFLYAVADAEGGLGGDGGSTPHFGAFGLAVTFAVTFAVLFAFDKVDQRAYLIAFSILFTLIAVVLPNWLAAYSTWSFSAPLLLFFGLLPLLNAPFDWVSLGLTRYLLRWGLSRGGWWPYVLALLDAAGAAVLITLLTVVSVLGIQAFDDAAAHSGAGDQARVLPLNPLFDGIQEHPAAPEYWWVYALLLSTMIPSLVNLAIGGTSLLRGIPLLTRLLLAKMPASEAPASYDRRWIPLALTGQWFVGAALGIGAQAVTAYAMFVWLLPTFGFDLLDLARLVAAPDLPGMLIQSLLD